MKIEKITAKVYKCKGCGNFIVINTNHKEDVKLPFPCEFCKRITERRFVKEIDEEI